MRPAGPTRLQAKQQALQDLLAAARNELGSAEYLVLLAFAVDVVAREVARCTRWDDRGDERESAA